MMKKTQDMLTETLDPAKCTAEQHVYMVRCMEKEHVLQWIRVERHQWSDWETEQEPDCVTPGEYSSRCRVCGAVRWQRSAPLGHVLQLLPEDDSHAAAVCRVCGRVLRHGLEMDAAQRRRNSGRKISDVDRSRSKETGKIW